MVDDMGLTPSEQKKISISYQANMEVIYKEILDRGMFSWQQQWNGQSSPTAKNGCCTRPLVYEGKTCAPTLRKLCAADSPAQTRVMNYAFSPGSCQRSHSPLVPLTAPTQDIANFLVRADTNVICLDFSFGCFFFSLTDFRVLMSIGFLVYSTAHPRALRLSRPRLAGMLSRVPGAGADQLGLRDSPRA